MKTNNMRCCSQRGIGLVEVLVSLAVMSVMAVVMMTMFDSQQRQIRHLLVKQDMIELRAAILRQFSTLSTCTWQLKDKVFDASSNPSSSVMSMLNNTLYAGPDATSLPIAAEGQFLPGSFQRAKVLKISFKELTPTLNPNEYRGQIEVSFDASPGFSLQPVTVQQFVSTEMIAGTNNRKIVSCSVDPSSPPGLKAAIFTAGGSFVAPITGLYKVTVIGAGGGGGAGVNQTSLANGAGGGGAGGTALLWTNLSKGVSYPVIVGSGGGGSGAGYGGAGGSGSHSSFQGAVANGGGGGGGSSSYSYGGAGGSAGGGTLNTYGGYGSPGGRGSGAPDPTYGAPWYGTQGGGGGASAMGGGGAGGIGGDGASGLAYGSGGGGGDGQNASGGNGAGGVVIIEWGA